MKPNSVTDTLGSWPQLPHEAVALAIVYSCNQEFPLVATATHWLKRSK